MIYKLQMTELLRGKLLRTGPWTSMYVCMYVCLFNVLWTPTDKVLFM